MKRLLLLLSVCALALGQVWADVQTISGTVLNAVDDEPVVGAAVAISGTLKGTITDFDGKFTVETEPGTTLIVSFIGMRTQEVSAADGMTVYLTEDTKVLDEVMVVGYGTATRAQFVGSAKAVDGGELTKQAASNVTNALQGKMAGVQVVNGSGQPGTGASIRIRGTGSINGGTTPLYIVDGAPYDESAINLISSYDIASMTVLKDAAATAIYGARGANGVVLITTKSGNNESKMTVNVDAKWGNNSRAVSNYDVMTDPAMYVETAYKALYNFKFYNGASAAASYEYADANIWNALGYKIYSTSGGERLIGYNFKLNPNAKLGYSDGQYYYTPDNWEKETLKTNNLRHEYNISVNGGNKDTQYFISAGYLNDPGIVDGSGFQRFTMRAKVDSQVKKWLKVGAQAAYAYADIQSPSLQTTWGSTGNVFQTANEMAPIYPFYVRDAATKQILTDAQGWQIYDSGNNTNFTRPGSAPRGNEAINLKINDKHAVSDNFSGSIYLTITPVEGLNLTARVSPEVYNTRSHALYNPFYSAASSGGSVSMGHDRFFTLTQQYLASYKKRFLNVHNIEVLAGWEQYMAKDQTISAANDHLFNPFIPEVSNAYGTQPTANNTASSTRTMKTAGLLARVQYDLMDRYFVNATYRYEGSSRFAPSKRWGSFGSIGAAWLINREGFMDNVDNVDELKLKVSWGTQGNDQVGTWGYPVYLDYYAITYDADNNVFSSQLTDKGNPDLTWEKQMLSNVGFEFGFFKNRLNGSVEYFNRTNSDMLFTISMPKTAGYSYFSENIGTVVNNGIEGEIEGVLLDMRNVRWAVNLNATWVKSKIKELPEQYKNGGIKYDSYILREGGSLVEGYMPVFAGIDRETGRALYYVDPDNGDRTTTANIEQAAHSDLGDLSVKVYGGFGTTLEAYGVDLSIQCAYQLGGKMYDGTYQTLMHTGAIGKNWHKDILRAWTPENPDTDVERLIYIADIPQSSSSRWLVSSDYLSLNNVTLGYTLPTKWTKKAQMQKVRIYFQGDNLGIAAARKGMDPRQSQNLYETGLGGYSDSGNFVYSQLRTLSGGISVTF